VQATGATYVDVSSGVERQAGEKDRDKISRFIQAARLEK
jgi:phosphoribosylanthranilate isomerase